MSASSLYLCKSKCECISLCGFVHFPFMFMFTENIPKLTHFIGICGFFSLTAGTEFKRLSASTWYRCIHLNFQIFMRNSVNVKRIYSLLKGSQFWGNQTHIWIIIIITTHIGRSTYYSTDKIQMKLNINHNVNLETFEIDNKSYDSCFSATVFSRWRQIKKCHKPILFGGTVAYTFFVIHKIRIAVLSISYRLCIRHLVCESVQIKIIH